MRTLRLCLPITGSTYVPIIMSPSLAWARLTRDVHVCCSSVPLPITGSALMGISVARHVTTSVYVEHVLLLWRYDIWPLTAYVEYSFTKYISRKLFVWLMVKHFNSYMHVSNVFVYVDLWLVKGCVCCSRE